ncbi:hypothetical protein BU16DRAFT_545389 [Lophium mytilinum]|uniref:Uncharacterized protein n=1 Tax=Lophium mytilinum TaxID=390894 RepID=A0A6A6Q8Q2_9PEZI|nr:hypothetical protein BU16DRAFT_545389 [Lophium mytilinum]
MTIKEQERTDAHTSFTCTCDDTFCSQPSRLLIYLPLLQRLQWSYPSACHPSTGSSLSTTKLSTRKMDLTSKTTGIGPSAVISAPQAVGTNWCQDVAVHQEDATKLEGATFIPLDQIAIIPAQGPTPLSTQATATTCLTIYNTGGLDQRNFGHGVIADLTGEIIGCWRKEHLVGPELKEKGRADSIQYQPREVALHNALQNPYGFSIRTDILEGFGPTYIEEQARQARNARKLKPRANESNATHALTWENDPTAQAVLRHVHEEDRIRANNLRRMFGFEPPSHTQSTTSSSLSSLPTSEAEEDAQNADDDQSE